MTFSRKPLVFFAGVILQAQAFNMARADMMPLPSPAPSPSPISSGNCEIIYPGQEDARKAYCLTPSYYGVAYKGYFVDAKPCFPTIAQALSWMSGNSSACYVNDMYLNCKMIYPGQEDSEQRHCVNPADWGVAYKGLFLSVNPCFTNVGNALTAMSTSDCQ